MESETRPTDDMDDEELLQYAIQLSIEESCQNSTSADGSDHFKVLEAINRGDLLLLQKLSDVPECFTQVDNRGWYPLHHAAVHTSPQVLEAVIYASYRLSLEEMTDDGETPMMLATQAGLVNNIRMLMEHGASPHRTNHKNESPLLLAVRMDLYDIARALLCAGASANQHCLKRWTAVHEAAKVGCTETLKLLLMHGGNINETDHTGVTPMAVAAEYGQIEILELLIEYGGDVNARAPNGDTVLYDAAGSGNPDCINLLIQHGANPNVASLSSQLPIHRAAYEGHYLALRIFIPITTRRALRLSGQSPIHSAADGGHIQCLELLVEKGFDVNALLDAHISENYGDLRRTALYFAVSNGSVTCTEMLLKAGAKTNLDPVSCLLVAVRAGRYEIVKLLLAKRADVNCYFTVVNDTVFPTALQYCLRDEIMMRLLLNNGYQAEKCFSCHHDSIWEADPEEDDCHPAKKIPFCDLVCMTSMQHLAGRAVRILLDYVNHVAICSKLKTALKKQKEWPEISLILGNPRPLRHLCRLAIRAQITPRRLADPQTMEAVVFPYRLKDYVMYREHDLYHEIICSNESD
ncbi:ankyrin repeat and SOCS box protein 15-like isoform X2 [Engraulis encrasicolus]|uniref:ankyrin repeat and SOCS box protein 15-like isoform X2 n=1 Tax=Engraulis encrasicolus TaxID=184585 RepID=UPI002FD28804